MDALPTDLDAAVAELVPVVTTLIKAPAEPAKTEAAPSPEDDLLELKFRRLLLLNERFNPQSMPRPTLLKLGRGFVSGELAFLGLLPPALTVFLSSGSPLGIGLAIAGGLTSLSGAIAFPFMPAKSSRNMELPLSLWFFGASLSAFGSVYSPRSLLASDASPLYPAGFHPVPLVAGTALAVTGALLLATSFTSASCSYEEDGDLFDTAMAANRSDRSRAIASVEDCGTRARERAHARWIPFAVSIIGFAGVAITAASQKTDSALFEWLIWGAFSGLGVVATMPFDSTIAGEFLDRLERDKLPLEVTLAPSLNNLGITLAGRF